MLRSIYNYDWQFYLLTFSLCVLVYTLFIFYQKSTVLIRSVFNVQLAEQSYRNKELSSSVFNICLYFIFVISTALLLSALFKEYGIFSFLGAGGLFFISLGLLSCVYLGKNIFLWFLSLLFPFGNDIGFYRFNLNLLNQLLGLCLTPLMFFYFYGLEDVKFWTWYLLLFLFVICLFYRYFKLFLIASRHIRFYKFYFFLYFCTSEIIPNVILVKLILE